MSPQSIPATRRRRQRERRNRREEARWLAMAGPVRTTQPPTIDDQRFVTHELRIDTYRRDAGQCQYCGDSVTFEECNVDHVIPHHAGGKTVLRNLVIACKPCNKLKGRQLIPERLRPNYTGPDKKAKRPLPRNQKPRLPFGWAERGWRIDSKGKWHEPPKKKL